MSYSAMLRKIDQCFEDGRWGEFENLVQQYESRFSENEAASEALDSYLACPAVQLSLPTWMFS